MIEIVVVIVRGLAAVRRLLAMLLLS